MYTTTEIFAALGAFTGSSALLWDITKWAKNGAKIRVTIRPRTVYSDSKVLEVKKIGDSECRELAMYYHIEVVNSGTLPTTLLRIEASTKKTGIERFSKSNGREVGMLSTAFIPHDGKTLPQVLNVGDVWSCRIEDTQIDTLFPYGKLKLFVDVAHRTRPIVTRLKLPTSLK